VKNKKENRKKPFLPGEKRRAPGNGGVWCTEEEGRPVSFRRLTFGAAARGSVWGGNKLVSVEMGGEELGTSTSQCQHFTTKGEAHRSGGKGSSRYIGWGGDRKKRSGGCVDEKNLWGLGQNKRVKNELKKKKSTCEGGGGDAEQLFGEGKR